MLLGGGRVPCQRPAHSANDACSRDGATPPAVADRIGDEQNKAKNTEPGDAALRSKTGVDETRGCINGVSATPPGSGPPAGRMGMATALGAQPETPHDVGEQRTLRAPRSVTKRSYTRKRMLVLPSRRVTMPSMNAEEKVVPQACRQEIARPRTASTTQDKNVLQLAAAASGEAET